MPIPDRTIHLLSALVILIGLFGPLSCTSENVDAPSVLRTGPTATPGKKARPRISVARLAKELHARINQERRRQGQPTFWWDAALGRIAVKHSRDMAKRNYFGHTSPDGRGITERYLKGHYACGVTINGVLRSGAEMIHRYPLDGADGSRAQDEIIASAIEAWMTNDEDRRTLLSPHWQREGTGVFVAPDGMVYITVNFC
jgi:uncharacterized protein YkwD